MVEEAHFVSKLHHSSLLFGYIGLVIKNFDGDS
jgi:hypothetical protein